MKSVLRNRIPHRYCVMGNFVLYKRTMAVVVSAVIVAITACPAQAQSTSFESATIRQSAPDSNPENSTWSPPGVGRFTARTVTLAFLIRMAYGIDDHQILGAPSWFQADLFDVVAKPEEGVTLTREQLKPLLQNLLKERFHLETHRETQLVKGYALVVAKKGPKLTPTSGDHPPNFRVHVAKGAIHGLNWSMSNLALMLQPAAGLPVVDQTGIKGSFDIDLDFAPDVESVSPLPSLFSAIQESLGLKLESAKVPVEMLVIDHADRIPTPN